MITLSFNQELQDSFAQLSGDFNPIHVDPIKARRLMFGTTVVHGVHALLAAIDAVANEIGEDVSLESLKASFDHPIKSGAEVTMSIDRDGLAARVTIFKEKQKVMRVRLAFKPQKQSWQGPESARIDCRDRQDDEMASGAGQLMLALNLSHLEKLFPALRKYVDPGQIAFVLATTRLVGMECPGLHSLYSGLSIKFDEGAINTEMDWHVENWNDRFKLLTISVESGGAQGKIECFKRPPPMIQPTMQSVGTKIAKDRYKNQRALVIGGSRGLGETLSKVIISGGGCADFTYFSGEADAERVVSEIVSSGATSQCFQFNIASPSVPEGIDASRGYTHLYYFASPFISASSGEAMDSVLLQRYLDAYCIGFAITVNALIDTLSSSALIVFPSTVFIDDPIADFKEYSAAKAAGEVIAEAVVAANPGKRLMIKRLDRLKTDQTQSISAAPAGDSLNAMIELANAAQDFERNT